MSSKLSHELERAASSCNELLMESVSRWTSHDAYVWFPSVIPVILHQIGAVLSLQLEPLCSKDSSWGVVVKTCQDHFGHKHLKTCSTTLLRTTIRQELSMMQWFLLHDSPVLKMHYLFWPLFNGMIVPGRGQSGFPWPSQGPVNQHFLSST